MKYQVNGTEISYDVEGEYSFGKDIILLKQHQDLTANMPWEKTGYTIAQLFEDADFDLFLYNTKAILHNILSAEGLESRDIPLEHYHRLIGNDYEKHLSVINRTKLLSTSELPVPVKRIEDRISEICGTDLKAHNPFDQQSVYHFRIVRPNSTDNNPLHRDVWLEDYDDCINLYIPIAGSSPLSSLILAPGSHLWAESRIEKTLTGALINGIRFNVPAVTDIKGAYSLERPSPGNNEVLVFSPYLIHGGAVNLSQDTTRISIEMRLWKKND